MSDKRLSRDDIRNRIRALRGEPPVPVAPADDAPSWSYVVISTADGPVVLANDGTELDHDPGVATLCRSEVESGLSAVAPEHRRAWLADFVAIRRVFGDAKVESVGARR
jgi:hypothetical protein